MNGELEDMEQQPWTIEGTLDLYQDILSVLLRATLEEWFTLDITLAQLKVLFLLSHQPPMTVGAIAQTIGIGLPTASQLIDRLVQAELVQRSERSTDRRYTQVSLTPPGVQLVHRLRQGRQERLRGWLESLSAEEMIQLRTGLLALARLAHLPLPEEEQSNSSVSSRSDAQELHRPSSAGHLQKQE